MRAFALLIIFGLTGWVQAQQRSAFLPNPKLTPGVALKANKDDLCGSGNKTIDGSLPISLRRRVFDLYGIRADEPNSYNVDHLIPVSLGGANTLKNLWPQPLAGEWNYQMKNKLEQRLHKMVCRGELDLETAQREISTDWIGAYKKYLAAPGGVGSRRD